MLHLNVFLFPFLCLLSLSFSTEFQEATDEPIENVVTRTQNDYKRRQEIAENYMKTLAEVKETWVDPYDMFGSAVEPSDDSSNNKGNLNPDVLEGDEKLIFSDKRGDVIGQKASVPSEPVVNKDSGGYLMKDKQLSGVFNGIYISRWLKKLISKVEEESEPIAIRFSLDSNALNSLKELSKSVEITQLDELICHMIEHSVVTQSWLCWLQSLDWSFLKLHMLNFLWGGCIVACLYVVYQCILHRPFLTMLVLAVMVSIFWHWMHLYQQKLSHHHAALSSGEIPAQCRKREFGLLEHIQEYFRSYFISDECTKYYEALMIDPLWEVSFTMAMSEAFTAMLFQPLSVASRQVNYSVKQLFDGLSIFMTLVLLVFFLLFLIMMFNYRIKLPFFMGAIEPSFPLRGSRVEDVHSKSRRMLKNKIYKVISQDKVQQLSKQPTDLSNILVKPKICNVASHLPPDIDTTGVNQSNQTSSLQGNCERGKIFEPYITDEDPSGKATDESDNDSFTVLDTDCEHYYTGCLADYNMQDLHTNCTVSENSTGTNQNVENSPSTKTLQNLRRNLVIEDSDVDIQTHDSHNVSQQIFD